MVISSSHTALAEKVYHTAARKARKIRLGGGLKKSSKKCRAFSTNYSALFCAFWAARKGHPPKSRR
jgi:capsule polysaccharide export protein KpsC/LpsZ